MWSTKEFIIFFAGASAFNTWIHCMFYIMNSLPIKFGPITLTIQLNKYAIIVTALMTAGLLWWANSLQ